MDIEKSREQCPGCFYFKRDGGDITCAYCHYMLYTGQRRERDESGKCLSKKVVRSEIDELRKLLFDKFWPDEE